MRAIICGTVILGLVATFAPAGEGKKDEKMPDVHAKKPGMYQAKVGDIVYFGVPNSSAPDKIVGGLKVKVNGKEIANPKTELTGAIGGGEYNFVYSAKKAGSFDVEVTPIYMNKDTKAQTSKFTLNVK